MKLRRAQIHNYRSIGDATIDVNDYTLLVGANNAGKSNLLNALRVFYEDLKWSGTDVPQLAGIDDETWIELTYSLDKAEWDSLADKYKKGANGALILRHG